MPHQTTHSATTSTEESTTRFVARPHVLASASKTYRDRGLSPHPFTHVEVASHGYRATVSTVFCSGGAFAAGVF